MLCSAKAQVGAGSLTGIFSGFDVSVVMHGTILLTGCAARLAIMVFCVFVGAKILLFVSRGTESCASERSPSYAKSRNVLSFLRGNPTLPPNCWRFRESLIGLPCAVREKVWPGTNACVKAKGSRAS